MAQMKSKYGERKFLFSVYKTLENAQKIEDDGKEFVVLPADLVKQISDTMLIVINRMDGPLFDEDEQEAK